MNDAALTLDEQDFELSEMSPFGLLLRARREGTKLEQIPVEVLRQLTRKHRLLLLRGFAQFESAEALTKYCTTWGEIMMWPFGAVLELVEHADPKDHIFDHTYVPVHWDGMYMPMIPAIQFFQCVNAPGDESGGQTTFSDTIRILEDVDAKTRELWEKVTVTYRIEKVEHYGGKAVSPLITRNPETGVPVLRYNEPPLDDVKFLNRPVLEFEGIAEDQVKELQEGLRAAIYDPRHLYAHDWRTGDMVVSDNHALLHGRMAFTSGSKRHLRRVHILGNPPFKNPAIS
ncbi:MAG TPA: TauD/TfdA family dioxygenase [Myxococcaceae bacterium]|nr:TauD/TfdA family dioxygenase [Myxococcaceae bacterium]